MSNPSPPAEPSAPDLRRLRGQRLLVAEDNPVSQMLLQAVLLDEGAQVLLADDGQAAVDRVRAGADVDLVLMDVQMPRLDGMAATARILELAPDLPVIGQTGDDRPEMAQRCRAAGMVAHLCKPVERETLVRLVLAHARRR